MSNEFVEFSQIRITGGKIGDGFKKMIALSRIFTIEPAAQNTALITLANGERITAKETYNELKTRFPGRDFGRKNAEAEPAEPLLVAAE